MSTWLKLEPRRRQVAIAGQVSNGATGQPIQGAQVKLLGGTAAFQSRLALQQLQYGDRWPTLAQRPDLTYSTMDGCFYFLFWPGMESSRDRYTIAASLPAAGTRYAEFVEESVTVTLKNAQLQRAMVTMALPPTALAGQIKDSENQPIRMALVRIVGSNESAFSDHQGNYVLPGLEASTSTADKRTITASAQGCEPISQPIFLPRGKTTPLNLTLKRTSLPR